MKNSSINIRIPSSLRSWIEKQAEQNETTMTDIVIEALIEKYIRRKQEEGLENDTSS